MRAGALSRENSQMIKSIGVAQQSNWDARYFIVKPVPAKNESNAAHKAKRERRERSYAGTFWNNALLIYEMCNRVRVEDVLQWRNFKDTTIGGGVGYSPGQKFCYGKGAEGQEKWGLGSG